jgi:hypothetical protein
VSILTLGIVSAKTLRELLRHPLNQLLRHPLNKLLRNPHNQLLRNLHKQPLRNLLNQLLRNLQPFPQAATRKTTKIVFLLDTHPKQTLVVRFGCLMVKGLIVLHCGESALEAVIAAEKLYALATMNPLPAYLLLVTQIQ